MTSMTWRCRHCRRHRRHEDRVFCERRHRHHHCRRSSCSGASSLQRPSKPVIHVSPRPPIICVRFIVTVVIFVACTFVTCFNKDQSINRSINHIHKHHQNPKIRPSAFTVSPLCISYILECMGLCVLYMTEPNVIYMYLSQPNASPYKLSVFVGLFCCHPRNNY